MLTTRSAAPSVGRSLGVCVFVLVPVGVVQVAVGASTREFSLDGVTSGARRGENGEVVDVNDEDGE